MLRVVGLRRVKERPKSLNLPGLPRHRHHTATVALALPNFPFVLLSSSSLLRCRSSFCETDGPRCAVQAIERPAHFQRASEKDEHAHELALTFAHGQNVRHQQELAHLQLL